MSAATAAPVGRGLARAWRIIGEHTDDDGTVHLLDAVSFGHNPTQAVFRYVTLLQPMQVRPLDGRQPVMFDLDELRAEPI